MEVGERIVVVCRIGYELNGAVVSRCMPDGRWSSGLPKCRPIKCKQPSPISNGYMSINTTTFKSIVKYSCDTGYQLKGKIKVYFHLFY